jgi:hypothetical protein
LLVVEGGANGQLGGNESFKSFMDSYGFNGGYTKGMSMQEKYNSWAAAQYREKVRGSSLAHFLSSIPLLYFLTSPLSTTLCYEGKHHMPALDMVLTPSS